MAHAPNNNQVVAMSGKEYLKIIDNNIKNLKNEGVPTRDSNVLNYTKLTSEIVLIVNQYHTNIKKLINPNSYYSYSAYGFVSLEMIAINALEKQGFLNIGEIEERSARYLYLASSIFSLIREPVTDKFKLTDSEPPIVYTPEKSSGDSTGIIIGVSVGSLVVLLMVYFILRTKNKSID